EADKVAVTAGSTKSGIDAALQPSVGQITGKVTDASTKAAVGGIEVCAYRAENTSPTSCARTDSGGEYTLTGLAGDEYKVGFSVPEASSLNYAPQFYNGKATLAEADK